MRFLIISVDTEADRCDKEKNKITSIEGVHFLQEACAKYGMVPTYLLTYEMAAREEAVRTVKPYLDLGQCEVGHHLHIWSTPPFEYPNPYGVDEKWIGGIQSELSDDLFDKKMSSLQDAIENNYGVKPTSHRAGRWSIDKRTLSWLEKNGYHVDSSVCPYVSWTHTKGIHDHIRTDTYHAPNSPYYPDLKDLTKKAANIEGAFKILEVPVTGVRGGLLSRVKIKGIGRFISILNRLGYCGVNDTSFRPLRILPLKVFQNLTHLIFQTDFAFINFMFHSNELVLKASPHSMCKSDLERIRRQILFALKTAKEYGMKGMTLSKVASHFNTESRCS